MSSGENTPEQPITLSDLNLRRPPTPVQTTICGKVRSFRTISILEWVYVGLSFVAMVACLIITIIRISSHGLSSSDFTFAVLLLLTVVFCCYYVMHSVLTERADELLVFVASSAIVLIYCVANYVTQGGSLMKELRLGIVCTLSPFLIGAGVYLSVVYFRSNNLIFNTVGSFAHLQKACRIFFFCSSLLEFDLQLQLSMLILVMGEEGSNLGLTQKIILGSGVVLTIIFVSLGFLALRRESVPLLITFYILGFLEPAYVIYKFYYAAKCPAKDTYESTFACGCFALAVWLLLMFCMWYFATHHFGKGLKEKLHGYKVSRPTLSEGEQGQIQHS